MQVDSSDPGVRQLLRHIGSLRDEQEQARELIARNGEWIGRVEQRIVVAERRVAALETEVARLVTLLDASESQSE